MIRNLSVRVVVTTSLLSPAILSAYPIIDETAQALKKIKKSVINKAQEYKKKMKAPSFLIKAGIGFGEFFGAYDPKTCELAMIARPFFKVDGADACLPTIGSTQEDIDYLKSVFTEFYASGERSEYRLVTILHRHMMVALGLPVTKTLDQFKHMMEDTNHHGRPKGLNHKQFDIYCRCVARGLYAVHWLKHGYN
jgi:hypothetical protein